MSRPTLPTGPWRRAWRRLRERRPAMLGLTIVVFFIALAVFAPSGLNSGYLGQQIGDSLWGDFFGAKKERDLAVAILNVQSDLCSNSAFDACQNYVLLGDPATRTVLPFCRPPTSRKIA